MMKISLPPFLAATAMEDRKSQFLEAYAEAGVDRAGLEAASIPRSLLKAWLASDPAFVELYMEAKENAIDKVELAAMKAAIKNHDMMKFILNANRKQIYGNTVKTDVTIKRNVKDLTDEELMEIASRAKPPTEEL